MAAHQASLSLGFSRQEHLSGLPFPSPMHGVKSESEVAQSCPTLSDPMDCSLPGFSIHGIFPGKSTGVGCHYLLQIASAGDARDTLMIPGSGRSLGGGHGNPLQYSCQENLRDRRTWWATVHRVTKSWTWLKQLGAYSQGIQYVDLICIDTERWLL